MAHTGNEPPTVEYLHHLKLGASSKSKYPADITEDFPATGAGQTGYRTTLLDKDGRRDPSSGHGWLHWRIESANAFDEVIVDEGGCPLVAK